MACKNNKYMQKRVFIAINLPFELKKQILNRQRKWAGIGLNLTKAENLHVTLAFIGYVEDIEADKIVQITEETVKNFAPFEIFFECIHPGPSEDLPRMIWLSGPVSKDLSNLSSRLAEDLKKHGIAADSKHGFKLHITLARARGDELRARNIKEDLRYSFRAEAIDVMESDLSVGEAKYKILKSIKLR